MFGIGFMKTSSLTYVLHFKNGRVKREGPGLSFFYYAPASTVVAVPLASADLPFAFTETTADFQTVTVQGQLTYRVAEPRRLAALLDFTVDARGEYLTDDPEKLVQRLINETQLLAGAFLRRLSLKDALRAAGSLATELASGLRAAPAVAMHGVEVLSVAVVSLKPTPEMARALEAEARESLQREADQAIYGRRNYAVEQERKIKESELNTEIALRQKKINADIAIEERRKNLIDLQTENEKKQADSRAYTLETTLKTVRDIDWRKLLVLGKGGLDPRVLIALAFRDLAENADKVGSLNITPDLLASLLEK